MLEEKLLDKPVLYEVVPPKPSENLEDFVNALEPVSRDSRLDAINLPELSNRQPPERLAQALDTRKELVVNIIAPSRPAFNAHAHALSKMGIRNLIVVGGEHSQVNYPGPNVLQALKNLEGDFLLGAVTIFSRKPKNDPNYPVKLVSEADRVFYKNINGAKFFTSQILLDAEIAKEFLMDYAQYQDRLGTYLHATIFLSFMSLASTAQYRFITETLEVYPGAGKALQSVANIKRGSIRYAEKMLNEIVDFVDYHELHIPLGLQVEQIGKNNVESTLELLDRLLPIFER